MTHYSKNPQGLSPATASIRQCSAALDVLYPKTKGPLSDPALKIGDNTGQFDKRYLLNDSASTYGYYISSAKPYDADKLAELSRHFPESTFKSVRGNDSDFYTQSSQTPAEKRTDFGDNPCIFFKDLASLASAINSLAAEKGRLAEISGARGIA